MTDILENALTILRVMNEAGIFVDNPKPRQEIAAMAGFSLEEFGQAEAYLIQAGFVKGVLHPNSDLWLIPRGIEYLQSIMSSRLPLSRDAEQILKYIIGRSNQIVSEEKITSELNLGDQRYKDACQQLLNFNLIKDITHQQKPFAAVQVTQAGRLAVQYNFRDREALVTYMNTTNFDQRGQQVTYQYNAAGDINFGAVQNRMEFVSELENLRSELTRAADAQVIEGEIVSDARYQIEKAVNQAKKSEPDKETIIDRLNEAKALLQGATAATGLVEALMKAVDLAQKLF